MTRADILHRYQAAQDMLLMHPTKRHRDEFMKWQTALKMTCDMASADSVPNEVCRG